MKKLKIAILTIFLLALTGVLFGCGDEDYTEMDLSQYMELGNYKGITYSLDVEPVTESQVEDRIKSDLQFTATATEITQTGTPAQMGDTVNVKFVGKIDGEEFDGGSSDGLNVTLGETPMIDGFSEGIVGHSVGEDFSLDLRFPDDYQAAEIAGKPVVFDVSINSISRRAIPELTDAWVQENTEYETVEAYRAGIREEMDADANQMATLAAKEDILSKLIDSTNFKEIPGKLVKMEMERTKELIEEIALKDKGISYEDYVKQVDPEGEEHFEEQLKSEAEDIVKRRMVIAAIAGEEEIKVTKSEVAENIQKILDESGISAKQFEDEYGMTPEKYSQKFDFKSIVLEDKVLDHVMNLGQKS